MINSNVFVTGSSGFIGRLISKHLVSNGFYVCGFDKKASQDAIVNEFVLGDLEDINLLRKSIRGMDCIIHLAAFSDDGDFVDNLIKPNIIGVYNIFEAAKLENISQIIFASSIQAADIDYPTDKIDVETRHPTNHYALLKIWAEDVGRMYSELYGISVLSIRLGWVLKGDYELAKISKNENWKKLYFSHNDLRRFFLKCLSSSFPNYASLYALSIQDDGDQYDMVPAREIIGYEPHDVFLEGLDFVDRI